MLQRFILRAALILGVSAFLIWQGWSFFGVKGDFKSLVQAQIERSLGAGSSVRDVRIGLGSVQLAGVNIVFPNSPYEVSVEELRLGYSLISLLKGSGKIQKTAEEITFYKPKLTLKYNAQKNSRPDVSLSLNLTREQEEQYRSFIKEYDFIKKITISDGEIVFREESSGRIQPVAKKINGWAYTDNNAHGWLRVAGHLFDSKEYNMMIYSEFNLDRGGIDFVNVDLQKYKLGNEIPFVLPNYFDVLDGTVNGHLTITERHQPSRGFNIAGEINLSDGRMKLISENLFFEDIQVTAEIKDWNLHITSASQTVNGSPTRVEGVIKNLIAPELDLRLTSQQLDVDKFLKQFLPEKSVPLRGLSQIDLTFTDSFNRPQIAGAIKADSLWLNNYKFAALETRINLKNQVLAFDEISGSLRNADISGSGSIDFVSPEKLTDFTFMLAGDFTSELQQLGAASADHCVGQARVKILGPLARPVSRGEYKLFFTEDAAQSLALTGSFLYSNRQLTLNSAAADNDFRLNVSAENLFIEPKYSIEVRNLQNIFVLYDNPELAFVRNNYQLNLIAESMPGQPLIRLECFRRENYEKLFVIATDTLVASQPQTLLGDILLLPDSEKIPGDFEIRVNAPGVELKRLFVGNRQSGSIEFVQNPREETGGAVLVSGFKFSQINSLLGEVLPAAEGELFGRIDVESRDEKPNYLGELWLFNGFIRGSGPFKIEASFAANSSELVCRRFALEKTDGAQIRAHGDYTFATREFDAEIAAGDVNIGELIHVITGKTDLVDGTATIQAALKGTGPKIPIYGRANVADTKILMFEFDETLLEFGENGAGNGSYLSKDALQIGHAILKKAGQFVVTGPAHLPLTSRESLDIHMSGDGNFLSLLSDIDPYFEKTGSSGHLNLQMSGNYSRPNFSNSTFTCQNGTMYLASVANRIENIEADLLIEPNDYFLDVAKLQGTIGGEPFWISNTNILAGLNHGIYEPLRVAGDDLNLGAIVLKTGPNGIPLNIPALMEGGDIGWYELAGKDSLEDFFVAGPWAHPVVRGEARIHHANLVFPFDESTGASSEYSLVQKILDNIYWDARAISKKDTRYVKQFTTGVYVNMEVDPDNSELNFSGILSDSSFRIVGDVISTRGEFEYIDLNFRVEKFGAEFDRTSLYPVVYGKAWTVVRDTSNIPSDVYLELYTLDEDNREVSKGRWDRVNIRLSSEFQGYADTEKDIMATLGYSSTTVEEQATRAVGYGTDKFIFRPIMRPIERQLERRLGLDVVRFSYALTRNFLDANLNDEQLSTSLALLRSSRLILGKYLTNDIYVIYTGELKAGVDYRYQDKGIGLQHIVGLEYRLNQRWLLQMEYDYNTLLQNQKDDKKIWLRHSFPF
jgi:hypothetical protein